MDTAIRPVGPARSSITKTSSGSWPNATGDVRGDRRALPGRAVRPICGHKRGADQAGSSSQRVSEFGYRVDGVCAHLKLVPRSTPRCDAGSISACSKRTSASGRSSPPSPGRRPLPSHPYARVDQGVGFDRSESQSRRSPKRPSRRLRTPARAAPLRAVVAFPLP